MVAAGYWLLLEGPGTTRQKGGRGEDGGVAAWPGLDWLDPTGLMSKRCPHWHCAPVRLVLVFGAHPERGRCAKNTRLHTKTMYCRPLSVRGEGGGGWAARASPRLLLIRSFFVPHREARRTQRMSCMFETSTGNRTSRLHTEPSRSDVMPLSLFPEVVRRGRNGRRGCIWKEREKTTLYIGTSSLGST